MPSLCEMDDEATNEYTTISVCYTTHIKWGEKNTVDIVNRAKNFVICICLLVYIVPYIQL